MRHPVTDWQQQCMVAHAAEAVALQCCPLCWAKHVFGLEESGSEESFMRKHYMCVHVCVAIGCLYQVWTVSIFDKAIMGVCLMRQTMISCCASSAVQLACCHHGVGCRHTVKVCAQRCDPCRRHCEPCAALSAAASTFCAQQGCPGSSSTAGPGQLHARQRFDRPLWLEYAGFKRLLATQQIVGQLLQEDLGPAKPPLSPGQLSCEQCSKEA